MNRLLKRILTVGASVALAAVVAVPALAEAETPLHTAEIDVKKILTSDIENVFPKTDEFEFVLTPLEVVDAFTGTTKPYNADTNPMPMPKESTTEGQTVTIDDTAHTATLTLKTLTKDATNLVKSKSAPYEFDFFTMNELQTRTNYTKPGIYTYTLQEKAPAAPELGLTYDPNLYYVNVYVTNALKENGQPDITEIGERVTTVSNITLYKGEGHNRTSDMSDKDNNGLKPGDKPTETTDTNYKIGINSDDDPNKITAPINNTYDAEDLTVSKVVTGNIADPDKEFEFTFTPATTGTGAPPAGYEYTYTIYNMSGDNYTINDRYKDSEGKLNDKTDATGNTKFKLKHKQFVVISGVPVGLKYSITEDASYTDYTAKVDWQNGTSTGTVTDDTNTTTADEGKTLADKVIETSKAQDGDNGVTRDNHAYFTNNKESTTPTGVLLRFAPFVLLAALLVAGIVLVVLNGKKRRETYQGL